MFKPNLNLKTTVVAKTLSALALTLMFGNVSHAGIISYQYSFSDSSNTITANFSIDDTKKNYDNLISGTFTWNGTTYTADASRDGDGYVDASNWGSDYSGYVFYLFTSANDSPDFGFKVANYSSTTVGDTKSIAFAQNGRERINLSAVGTLKVVPTVSAVPVPAAAWLFGSGLVGLVGLRRRKQAL